MLRLRKWLNRVLRTPNESGASLVEALVAIAIMGGVVLTMILSISGGALAVEQNDHEVIAQSLARTQLEGIKNAAYATSYSTMSAPAGYGISVGVSSVLGGNANIQKITTNITLNSVVIMTVVDYKVNR
jgi:type II secretory pathway pseudopilin PulG